MKMTQIIDRFDGTEYRFLSNFYPCVIVYEGIEYPSTEHAYQAAKTLDQKLRLVISKLKTPGESKRAGRRLVIREDWDDVKLQVMEDVLRLKFAKPHLQKKLLSTGDAILIEGNTWGDKFWGVCDGVGKNHLGNLLMKLRAEYVQ